MVEPDFSFNKELKFWVIYDPMVTEHEKLKFRYFSFLFIIFVTKHNRIHVYLVKEAFTTQYKRL